jgi:hypothetical protein
MLSIGRFNSAKVSTVADQTVSRLVLKLNALIIVLGAGAVAQPAHATANMTSNNPDFLIDDSFSFLAAYIGHGPLDSAWAQAICGSQEKGYEIMQGAS